MFAQGITRNDFIDRYDKQKTRQAVLSSLRAFDDYRNTKLNVSELDYFLEIKKSSEQDVYMELDRIVQFWKSKLLSPKSIQLYFTFTRAWFRVNGIRTFDDLIKSYVKMPKVLREKSQSMTHEIATQLKEKMNKKYALFFEFICYSGMRLGGEALNIQVRDIVFSDPIKIRIRAEIAKTGVERITFVPISLKVQLENLCQNKKPEDKVFDFTYDAYYKHFWHVRKQLGILDKKKNGRNFHLNPYKARKYAKTNLSMSTDSDFSEHILGHENGVKGTYYEAEDSKLAEIYKKAEAQLKI